MGSDFDLYEALLDVLARAENQPWRPQRIVLTPTQLKRLTEMENERRASQASEHYKPPAPIDPETLDAAEVRIFGLPIRVDDTVTAPTVEVVDG